MKGSTGGGKGRLRRVRPCVVKTCGAGARDERGMEAKKTVYNTHSSGHTHNGREEGRRRYERHGQDSRKVCVRRRGSASELVHITHVLSMWRRTVKCCCCPACSATTYMNPTNLSIKRHLVKARNKDAAAAAAAAAAKQHTSDVNTASKARSTRIPHPRRSLSRSWWTRWAPPGARTAGRPCPP